MENRKNDLMVFSEEVKAGMNHIRTSLYGGAIADHAVVEQVYEAVQKRLKNKESKLPNFVIMGGPGSGKTTLAKKLANYFYGLDLENIKLEKNKKENWLLTKSAADLKGAHVGQTAGRVFDMLKEAAENDQIIFIDEAYHLQEDEFGREAVDILLPVMSGDRDVIEKAVKGEKKGEQGKETYSFSEAGKQVPPIWLGGYEHEMRKMLSENQGLYRRMVKLSLTTPSVKDLYQCLQKLSMGNKVCAAVFSDPENEKEIKQYFIWGMRPEYMDYFASYAGVEAFYATAEVFLTDRLSKKEQKQMLYKIIKEKKEEIKRQHKAVLTDIQKAEFEVETDIMVTLKDVICSDTIKAELQEIINNLYFCASRPENGLSAPKGALFVGPSGTGKTFMARAVAGEIQKRFEQDAKQKDLKIGFIEISAVELGKREKLIRLFEPAGEYDTCIIFIDALDSIAKKQEGAQEASELLMQLLKEMDGFKAGKNIFVVAAATTKNALDSALLRPGRFEYCFELKLPNMAERTQILRKYIGELPLWQKELTEEEIGYGDEEDFDLYMPSREELNHPEEFLESLKTKYAEFYAWGTMGYSPVELKALVSRAWVQYLQIEGEPDFSFNKGLNRFCGKLDDVKKAINTKKTDYCDKKSLSEFKYLKRNLNHLFEFGEENAALRRAVHQLGHFLFRNFSGEKSMEKDISIFPEEGDGTNGWIEKYPADVGRLRSRLMLCLGGRIMEEVFFKDEISVEAMQDVREARQYAEEIFHLYGEWFSESSAEEIVKETLYFGGRGLLFTGWQKEQLAQMAYTLCKQERVPYLKLEKEVISIGRLGTEGKRLRRLYYNLPKEYSLDMVTSALVIAEQKKKRNHLEQNLRSCGIEHVFACDLQQAEQYCSVYENPEFDLVVYDYADFFFLGKLSDGAKAVMEGMEQWQVNAIACVTLGDYLQKLTGDLSYEREDTAEEQFKMKQVTIPHGAVWYIPDRNMTEDFKAEIVQVKKREHSKVKQREKG